MTLPRGTSKAYWPQLPIKARAPTYPSSPSGVSPFGAVELVVFSITEQSDPGQERLPGSLGWLHVSSLTSCALCFSSHFVEDKFSARSRTGSPLQRPSDERGGALRSLPEISRRSPCTPPHDSADTGKDLKAGVECGQLPALGLPSVGLSYSWNEFFLCTVL